MGRWRGVLEQEDLPVKYIKMSEHLDMLGVTLKASYMQTRKTNGDELRVKIENLIGGWRGGRFMPLTQRPYSLNTYCLPLLWYRCHSVDLREGDFNKFSSIIKSWLYADTLEKPEELLMYRARKQGGLGIHHIKSKATAILIRSFLETAIGDKFIRNNYHHALFLWHVLKDNQINNPGSPKYYSTDFFNIIRDIHFKTDLNIKRMTSGEWYRVILERNLTMITNHDGSMTPKLSKIEIRNPGVEWERTWSIMESKILSADQRSFLLKVVYNILPTKARLSRMRLSDSANCDKCSNNVEETIQHALLECSFNNVNDWIIAVMIDISEDLIDVDLSSSNLVTLNIPLESETRQAVAWFLATVFSVVWRARQTRKAPTINYTRLIIETELKILKETRYRNIAESLENAINFKFYL